MYLARHGSQCAWEQRETQQAEQELAARAAAQDLAAARHKVAESWPRAHSYYPIFSDVHSFSKCF